eukprot:TRINITY_DN72265_c0_g1_i1.p1 TRINITY_DN72265_c0_g1~~TRINITY_DN72265_c0_g1_i1.p1  ORF type:complete len:292 (+),score=28.24 TRINITY_DN72265_c0_g1_i1:157-1032(+)
MCALPFSLRIFVADGDPDGLRLVERSNWIGKAVVFPRALLPKIKGRDEFSQTGIYLLLGPREDGDGDQLYIGEGDPIRPRLDSHFANKDFWTRAVFFVAGAGQLNKAHVQFLESRLVKLAATAKRLPLENGNHPTEPSLSEADRADMEVFLSNILSLLPVLGIHAFELPEQRGKKDSAQTLLTCKGKGAVATGYDTTQGFVVKSDSFAVGLADEPPSLATHVPSVQKLRRELIGRGVLKSSGARLHFAQDYTFSSPSLAAAVVLGRSANGRTEWHDANGKTLKQLQEAATR